MAKMIEGVVSRIFVKQAERFGQATITLKLEGNAEIFVGGSMERGRECQHIVLTKPGDAVSFEFHKDFNDYFVSFVNHTLEGELERDRN